MPPSCFHEIHGCLDNNFLESEMRPTNEPQPSQLSVSQPIASQNSSIAYGVGSFGLDCLYTVFSGFHMFYYIDELGLVVGMAAIINVIYGFWDAFNDPLVGFLSDNTRTRWGRRRPWLLIGLPFYVRILVLVYAVPNPFLQGNALFWYALIIFFLFEAAYTVMSLNYAARFPELFQGFRERARKFNLSGPVHAWPACRVLHPTFYVCQVWFCSDGNELCRDIRDRPLSRDHSK
jgi:hypothetical protein